MTLRVLCSTERKAGKKVVLWLPRFQFRRSIHKPGECQSGGFVKGNNSATGVSLSVIPANSYGLVEKVHVFEPELFQLTTPRACVGCHNCREIYSSGFFIRYRRLKQSLLFFLGKNAARTLFRF